MTRKHPRTAPGFTLAEVLIAIGIFAIGMIAVASLFPVGALLQKQTADDILGKQSSTNARATLEAIGLTRFPASGVGDLDNYHNASAALYPSPSTLELSGVVPIDEIDALGSSFYNRYTLAERSFPTTEFNAIDLTNTPPWPTQYETRDHYWFFYVRDTAGSFAGPSWQGYVLVVERKDGQNYTDVFNGLDFGLPTQQDTPYITIDGKTGSWNVLAPITPLGGGVFFHPQGVGVETFTFNTIEPTP